MDGGGKPSPSGSGKAVVGGVLTVLVLASGLAVVHTQHQCRQRFAQLQVTQEARDALEIEWRQLLLEESTLATEAVVDQVARSRLNMVLPGPDQVVYVTR